MQNAHEKDYSRGGCVKVQGKRGVVVQVFSWPDNAIVGKLITVCWWVFPAVFFNSRCVQTVTCVPTMPKHRTDEVLPTKTEKVLREFLKYFCWPAWRNGNYVILFVGLPNGVRLFERSWHAWSGNVSNFTRHRVHWLPEMRWEKNKLFINNGRCGITVLEYKR